MLTVLLALALAGPLPAPADTVLAPGAADVEVTPRLNVFSLYSGTHGFGLAGGVRARSGATTATLDGRLSQFLQAGALTLDTHDPASARVFGRLRGVGSTESRWRYHGTGGATAADDRVDLDLATAQATAAVGVRPLASRALTVLPRLGARVDRLGTADDDAPLDRLDARSLRAYQDARDETRRAVSAGLAAELDTRDRAQYPSRGALVAAGVDRILSVDGTDGRFVRYDASAAGFVPLGQRVVLFGRASLAVMEADGDREIPVYYLPTVDPDRLAGFPVGRFRGDDAALFSVGARVPIIDALGAFGLDAVVTASAGNAYRDVFREFTPALTFRSDPDGDRAPLRPVLGVGLALVNIPKGKVALGGSVGVGPEGLTLLALRLSTGLGDDLPTLW